MHFDPDNPVCRRCIEGLDHEGRGDRAAAHRCYQQAWDLAQTDLDRIIAAHYLARTQTGPTEKLRWDRLALDLALNIDDDQVRSLLASLHLNVGKCHEDLDEPEAAAGHYRQAQGFTAFLPDDGYGAMIRGGVSAAMKRVDAM